MAPASLTPGIRIEGAVNLFAHFGHEPIPEGYIDLDTGASIAPLSGDLVFLAGGGTDLFFFFHPVNGASAASMGVPGPENPTPWLEDCAQADWRFTDTYPIGPGDYVCVLTDEGRLSLVWVESADDDSNPYRVGIRFVTWE